VPMRAVRRPRGSGWRGRHERVAFSKISATA
jgi:hypothetical protein